MLARLDRETERHHSDGVWGWTRLLDATLSRDDYVQQLVSTYGFEAPFEAACQYTPGLGQAIEMRGRWRSGLIAQDLLAIGWSTEAIANVQRRSMAVFQDAGEALGWLYAVERATLFHLDVRDAIVARFPGFQRACSYLGAYERVVSRRWGELGIAIDRACTSQRVAHRIVAAADEAFAALRAWGRCNDSLLRSVG